MRLLTRTANGPVSNCILGNNPEIYASDICELLSYIRKPGDEREPLKIAIISPARFSRKRVSEYLVKEISTLVKVISFNDYSFSEEKFQTLFEENRIYLCEECQFLFERRPYGFNHLNSFLSQVVTSDRQIITTWNQYAWNFLSGFIDVERWFPIVVYLKPLSYEELRSFLVSGSDQELRYTIGKELSNRLEIVKQDISLNIHAVNISIKLPYLALQRRYTTRFTILSKNNIEPADVIIRAIHRYSQGFPGIAKKLWEKAIKDDEISFLRIPEPVSIPDLSPQEMFILTLILMYEQTTFLRLKQSVPDEPVLNSALYRLNSAGVITKDNDEWAVTNEAFISSVKYLMQRRMIW